MSRPEHTAPPELFYGPDEAVKYARNTRMIEIQSRMAERALSLLGLPEGFSANLLDIGCGSGLSGEVLSEAGHVWTGVDIAPSMLGVALEREVEGDMICGDIGQGLMFRPGSFDGAISVSVVQWLCNADRREHVPQRRLKVFFQSLYNCLARGARAVLQLYPETPQQMTLITRAAMSCGFGANLVIDNPESVKAKKYYLMLDAGAPLRAAEPAAASASGSRAAMEEEEDDDDEDDEEGGDEDEDDDDVGGDAGRAQMRVRKEEERELMPADRGHAAPPAAGGVGLPAGEVMFTVGVNNRERGRSKSKGRIVKDKAWVLRKKERRRAQGLKTARDSKYTARSRGPRF